MKKGGGEWLVGEKCTYADLAFVPWYWLCPAIMGEGFDKVSSFFCSWFLLVLLFGDLSSLLECKNVIY